MKKPLGPCGLRGAARWLGSAGALHEYYEVDTHDGTFAPVPSCVKYARRMSRHVDDAGRQSQTAPCAAEPTSLAYLPSTPEV
jgi:hypothetical protein